MLYFNVEYIHNEIFYCSDFLPNFVRQRSAIAFTVKCFQFDSTKPEVAEEYLIKPFG